MHYQNGWTDPKDSTGVHRQQHGIRTQNPGDVISCSPLETVILFYVGNFALINTQLWQNRMIYRYTVKVS